MITKNKGLDEHEKVQSKVDRLEFYSSGTLSTRFCFFKGLRLRALDIRSVQVVRRFVLDPIRQCYLIRILKVTFFAT